MREREMFPKMPPFDSPLNDRALSLAKSLLLVSASSMRDVNSELCLDCDVVLERDVINLCSHAM